MGKAFWPKWDYETGDWSILYSVKLNDWTHHQILSRDEITNEMSGACSKYWGEEEVHTRVWRENPKERDQLEDLCVDGRTILKWILNQLGRLGLH